MKNSRADFVALLTVALGTSMVATGCGAGGGTTADESDSAVSVQGAPVTPTVTSSRFMSDPHAVLAMAGRFESHAQTVEDRWKRVQSAVQPLSRELAVPLASEEQAIVRDVLAAGDFWGGSGSVACQEFITQVGRNFQIIYELFSSFQSTIGYAAANQASRNIVNMMRGVRDGLIRDANNYEQAHFSNADPETASTPTRSPLGDAR